MPTSAEVRASREQAGLTQEEAADLLGITRVGWARYETGEREMASYAWAYWKHVAGLERIPFRSRPTKG